MRLKRPDQGAQRTKHNIRVNVRIDLVKDLRGQHTVTLCNHDEVDMRRSHGVALLLRQQNTDRPVNWDRVASWSHGTQMGLA